MHEGIICVAYVTSEYVTRQAIAQRCEGCHSRFAMDSPQICVNRPREGSSGFWAWGSPEAARVVGARNRVRVHGIKLEICEHNVMECVALVHIA